MSIIKTSPMHGIWLYMYKDSPLFYMTTTMFISSHSQFKPNTQNENSLFSQAFLYPYRLDTGVFGQLVQIQILLHRVYSQRAIDGQTARMCNIDPVGNHSTTRSETHILLCDEFKGTRATFLWAAIIELSPVSLAQPSLVTFMAYPPASHACGWG